MFDPGIYGVWVVVICVFGLGGLGPGVLVAFWGLVGLWYLGRVVVYLYLTRPLPRQAPGPGWEVNWRSVSLVRKGPEAVPDQRSVTHLKGAWWTVKDGRWVCVVPTKEEWEIIWGVEWDTERWGEYR